MKDQKKPLWKIMFSILSPLLLCIIYFAVELAVEERRSTKMIVGCINYLIDHWVIILGSSGILYFFLWYSAREAKDIVKTEVNKLKASVDERINGLRASIEQTQKGIVFCNNKIVTVFDTMTAYMIFLDKYNELNQSNTTTHIEEHKKELDILKDHYNALVGKKVIEVGKDDTYNTLWKQAQSDLEKLKNDLNEATIKMNDEFQRNKM